MKGFSLFSALLLIGLGSQSHGANPYEDYQHGDYKIAKSNIETLAKKGDKRALYYLGLMKINGYGLGKNQESGIEDIARAAKGGYLPARLYLGKLRLSQDKPEKALYWYKLAAGQGDIASMLFVASCYKFGYGVKANHSQSQRYLSRAARNNNRLAQYYLAEGFLKSSRKSTRRMGLNWLKQSARGGSVLAQLALARLFEEGRRVAYSPNEVSFWLNKAMANTSVNPDLYIGDYFASAHDLSDKEKALSWYQKAAEVSAQGKYKLGRFYLENNFYQQSTEKGIQLIEQAANEGNSDAQKALAEFYQSGSYVSASKEQAEFWKNKLQENASARLKDKALSWISYGLQDKDILKKLAPNQVLPAFASKEASKQGAINLGAKNARLKKEDVYQSELTLVSPNQIEIIDLLASASPKEGQLKKSTRPFPFYPLKNKNPDQKYFNKLYSKALLGNREAQFELAQYYHFGVGVKKDIPTALSWYYDAAMQHHMGSEYGLGLIYLQGDGVAQDLKSAKAWLELSSFKGNPYAQYALAYAHQQGLGEPFSDAAINQDLARAKSLYHLASSMKIADAEYNLANLYAVEDLDKLSHDEKKERVLLLSELFESAKEQGITEAEDPLAFYYLASQTDPDKLKWAFQKIKDKAESGNPNSALLLAVMLDRGLGVNQDKQKAKRWLKVAARENNPVAQFILGTYLYQHGVNAAEKEEGRSLLSKSSYNGFSISDYNLAVTFKDSNLEHMGLVNKSSANGFIPASLFLADLNVIKGDAATLRESRETYYRLSRLGNSNATLKLGYMMANGLGGKKDLKKAKSYYLKAARENNPLAQYLIAQSYQFGQGTKVSPVKALYWYKRAAAQGFDKAYLSLGFLYETEFKQYDLAKNWYEKALKNDQGLANFNLALMYDYGKGSTKENKQQAFGYYLQAANSGVSETYYPLALKYYNGVGTERNVESAYNWFNKAYQQGDNRALAKLAFMNEMGVGTKKDAAKAIIFYQALATLGQVEAMISAARLYQQGKGVPQDLDKAFNYYQMAADKGNKFAKYQVAKMRLEGEGVIADKERAIKELEALKKQNYPKAVLLLEKITPKEVDGEAGSLNDSTNNESANSEQLEKNKNNA
jgi:enhanced entry protein EnhC